MNMSILSVLVAAPFVIALYAYVVYPASLWAVSRLVLRRPYPNSMSEWPLVTVTVPVYNSGAVIAATLERLLDVDYPRDRLQIIVLSDASTDATDDIVRSFAPRGVELVRMSARRGKTAMENAAAHIAKGDIIVNVDSSILIPRDSFKPLIASFADPTIGVASGCDVSVAAGFEEKTKAEAGYVNYEMWLRGLETRLGTIVGASGCFYGIRRIVHAVSLPSDLSWDFASALAARKLGLRSVSVPEATCMVPRAPHLETELRRKVRTMARGIRTLFYYRELLNPFAYGRFAGMLLSHKLLRWLPYLFLPIAAAALVAMSFQSVVARYVVAVAATIALAGWSGIRNQRATTLKPFALAAFGTAALFAGFLAWVDALRHAQTATWEPTRRKDALARSPSA